MPELKAKSIRQMGDAVYGRLTLPKTTAAEAIKKGHFLRKSSEGVTKMTNSNQWNTFVGVSAMQSDDAKGPQSLLVYAQCVVVVPAASAQYSFGEAVSFEHGEDRVEKATAGNQEAIGWVWEADTGADATEVKIMVDVTKLGGLFPAGVAAGGT